MFLTRCHLIYIYIYTMHIRIFRMSICTVAFAYQCPIVLAFQYYPRRNACVCEHWKFCFDCKDWSLHSTSIWLLSPYKNPWKCEPYCSPLWARPPYERFRQCPKEGCVLHLFSWCLLDFPNWFWWDHCTQFARTQPQHVFRPTCCMAFWTWTSLWILPVMRPYRDDISGYWGSGIRALKSHPDLKPEETDQQKPIDRIRLLLLILASSCHIYCLFFFSAHDNEPQQSHRLVAYKYWMPGPCRLLCLLL